MKRIMMLSMLSFFAASVSVSVYADDREGTCCNCDCDYGSFDGTFFALGVSARFLENKASLFRNGVQLHTEKHNNESVTGVAAFGAGKVFGKRVYFGGEVLCDFGKSDSKDVTINGSKMASVRTRGTVPEISVRFGVPGASWLAYWKFGSAFTSTTLRNAHGNEVGTLAKPSLVTGGGLEKKLSDRLCIRAEALYNLGNKKRIEDNGLAASIRCCKGVTLRLFAACRITK